MGHWDDAIIRSVGWVFLFVIAYSIYELGVPLLTYPIQDFVAIFGLFASVYLALSVTGWLIIGVPFHWAICKWATPKYVYYLLSGALIILTITLFGGHEAGVVLGLPATIQALIFRFYVFKPPKI
ncbi:hypothetical protein [Photobacterium sp. Hal280]|uniref:hypothetical protein n=1 Tax=Photobacterium sp. Hal280 TaxID=3035163 RepID=UPI00301CEA29